MIAHKTKKRRDSKSSFALLKKYLEDEKNSGAKVLDSWAINCLAGDDKELAVKEILATQAMNTRSNADKTYHLVISFRDNDSPTLEHIRDIEQEYCEALGYGDHQRMVAVHNDTANLHIHVGINKVHPEKFTNIEPFRDYYILDEVSKNIEKKYGFEVDNRIDRDKKSKSKYQGKSSDIEAHRGLESFQKWCISNLKDPLLKLKANKNMSWRKLGDEIYKYGVKIKERGSGLVVSSLDDRYNCKLSSIDRQLSKKKLEGKLGEFEPILKENSNFKTVYEEIPIIKGHQKNKLFLDYKNEKARLLQEKNKLISTLKNLRNDEISKISNKFGKKFIEIKEDKSISNFKKRPLYSINRISKIKEIEKIKVSFNKDINSIRESKKIFSWKEFLINKSESGNTNALALLKEQKEIPNLSSRNSILPGGDKNEVMLFFQFEYFVKKSGDVVYRYGKDSILIDKGSRLDIKANNEKDLMEAFIIAKKRFGNNLEIDGSREFINKAEELSKELKISNSNRNILER